MTTPKPPNRPNLPPPLGARLDAWKEIAEYIGRDVRTAIRWEHERGLPVHRVPGGKRGTVFAFTHEIDGWLLAVNHSADGQEPFEPPRQPGADSSQSRPASSGETPQRSARSGWFALLAGSLTLLLVAGLALQAGVLGVRPASTDRVAAIKLAGSELAALDEGGRLLWKHDFGRRVLDCEDPEGRPRPSVFTSTDLDSDGRPDLVVNVGFDLGNGLPGWDELFAFSAQGRVLWSHRIEETLVFGAGAFSPPWHSAGSPAPQSGPQVAAFEVDGQRRIAWAQSHRTWWPSVLTVFDASGRFLSRWVHGGVIHVVTPAKGPSGPVLLLGGVSNSREAAFFAVLDARHVEGSGPEEPGSPFECLSCTAGRPLRYFVIEPSEQRLAVSPYNHIPTVTTDPTGVEVHAHESSPESPFDVRAVARFSPAFDLEHIAWTSSWASGHRRLERAGKLDHPIESCPERGRSPRVREWTQDAGWRDVQTTPAGAASAEGRGFAADYAQGAGRR
jgi:hypothetical protein